MYNTVIWEFISIRRRNFCKNEKKTKIPSKILLAKITVVNWCLVQTDIVINVHHDDNACPDLMRDNDDGGADGVDQGGGCGLHNDDCHHEMGTCSVVDLAAGYRMELGDWETGAAEGEEGGGSTWNYLHEQP